MLFTLGHGQLIVVEPPSSADAISVQDVNEAGRAPPGDVVAFDAVIERPAAAERDSGPGTQSVGAQSVPTPGGPFAYYFEDAPPASDGTGMGARLDALADAMVEDAGDPDAQNSGVPPIFTYFGQFIDHDITANTDREAGASVIDGADLTPLPRGQVTSQLFNLRNGALELDSVYGDGPDQGPFSRKLARLMRHPSFHGKMRLGATTLTGPNDHPPLPADPAADLLRLGRIVGNDPAKQVTLAELQALPAALKKGFFNEDGSPLVQKAIIGDARNDENLIVAQLHTAILRFHNRVVDFGDSRGVAADEVFEWARRRVRWHYQWLIVNAYLPTICDPTILAKVKAAKAPIYSAFYHKHATAARKRMPLPLEFSVAGFRFGHSMVRSAYDHNRFFGRAEGGSSPFLPRAPFNLLFSFTGNGHPPMPIPGQPGSRPTLPNNWIIEWARFVEKDAALTDRSARRIDTHLAPPLAALSNETAEPVAIFKHLARRNLRRGHRLNIPFAQDCITRINDTYGHAIVPLDDATLTSGKTGDAIRDGWFTTQTPLWFYVLKEAETQADGKHLGPLGSTIVAETLLGLVLNDPTSYWHRSGSDAGRWQPKDGAKPDGHVVDSIPALLKAAGVL